MSDVKVNIRWDWNEQSKLGYLYLTDGADKFVSRTEIVEAPNATLMIDYDSNGDILGIEVME